MTNYNQRMETAKKLCAVLAKKYRVEICSYDKTALAVCCTENELVLICKQLKCSGIYSEISKTAIITNFGVYK
jgi:phage-related protein